MAEDPAFHGSTDDHGASVAAWFGVLALLVASAVIAAGVYLNQDIITIIGVVLAVIGLVVGIILAKLGFGVGAKRREISEARAAGKNVGGHHRA